MKLFLKIFVEAAGIEPTFWEPYSCVESNHFDNQ